MKQRKFATNRQARDKTNDQGNESFTQRKSGGGETKETRIVPELTISGVGADSCSCAFDQLTNFG